MRCNPEKINQFFENTEFNDDIKKLVLQTLEYYFSDDIDILTAQVSLLALGFYEVEKSDDLDDEDLEVFDFYKLSKLTPDLQKLIISKIKKRIKRDDDENFSDFFEEFLRVDLKIIVPFEKWEKTNRKNKLTKLNSINV